MQLLQTICSHDSLLVVLENSRSFHFTIDDAVPHAPGLEYTITGGRWGPFTVTPKRDVDGTAVAWQAACNVQVARGMWHVPCGMWQLACGTSHVARSKHFICGIWHVACGT